MVTGRNIGLLGLLGSCLCAGGPNPTQPVCEIRLLQPISSDASKPGDAIQGIVLADVMQDEQVLIPRGSVVHGRVAKTIRVGRGLVHERAGLDLEFNAWEHPRFGRHSLTARLSGIDNARETVTPSGRVKGVLAAGGASGLLLGMWRQPDFNLFARTAYGFAGVTKFIWDKVNFTPVSIAGMIGLRFVIVRWPEPEIRLPAGTDLNLMVDAPSRPFVEASYTPPGEIGTPEPLLDLAGTQPFRTTRPKTSKPGDVTNMMFLGSREQITGAFTAAGWVTAETLTRGTALRTYRAMTELSGYPRAPMSRQLLNGRRADLKFQKSFNTMAKRHHIRIWKLPEQWEGNDVWIAAATHDIAIKLHPKAKVFTHVIDPLIDRERRKVVTDLTFAGCAEWVSHFHHPNASYLNLKDVATDGRVAAIQLRACDPEAPASEVGPAPGPGQKTAFGRLSQRLVLEGRNSVIRGNIYYWGYRAGRHGIGWARSKWSASGGASGKATIAATNSLLRSGAARQ